MAQVRNKNLTAREKQIAHLTAQGFIQKEIASKLFISMGTVHTHIKNIHFKMGTRTMADITREYILSLPKATDVFKVAFFMVLQMHIMFNNVDVDARASRVVRVGKNHVTRLRNE